MWQAAWPELRVALLSGCDTGARAFASVIPTTPALRLGGTEVRDAFRLMFALPWAIATWVFQCVCGALVAHEDIMGHHCLTCDGAGEWLRSHNVLRDVWIRILREAGLTASGDKPQKAKPTSWSPNGPMAVYSSVTYAEHTPSNTTLLQPVWLLPPLGAGSAVLRRTNSDASKTSQTRR